MILIIRIAQKVYNLRFKYKIYPFHNTHLSYYLVFSIVNIRN